MSTILLVASLLVASIKYMRYYLSMTTIPPNNKNNELNDRASLIASLTAFSLQHILHIIIESSQDGELYVGGTDQDGRAWVEDGKITGFSVSTLDDSVTSAEKALFELALFDNAWAYFTLGRSAPTSTCSEELRGIVNSIGPQLEEYHSLIKKMPLNATVQLNQDSPSDSVQMSSVQWKVLTKIGSRGSQQIREIVSSADTSQVDTLKVLDQLIEARLITVEQTPGTTSFGTISNEATPGSSINGGTGNNTGNPPSSGAIGSNTIPATPSTVPAPPSGSSLGLPSASQGGTPPGHAPASASVSPSASRTEPPSASASRTYAAPAPATPAQSTSSVPLGSVNSSEPDREVVNALRETVDPLGGFILVTDSPARYDTRPEQKSINTGGSDDMQFPTGLGDIS